MLYPVAGVFAEGTAAVDFAGGGASVEVTGAVASVDTAGRSPVVGRTVALMKMMTSDFCFVVARCRKSCPRKGRSDRNGTR